MDMKKEGPRAIQGTEIEQSLGDFLSSPQEFNGLKVEQRFKIVTDIACKLVALHATGDNFRGNFGQNKVKVGIRGQEVTAVELVPNSPSPVLGSSPKSAAGAPFGERAALSPAKPALRFQAPELVQDGAEGTAATDVYNFAGMIPLILPEIMTQDQGAGKPRWKTSLFNLVNKFLQKMAEAAEDDRPKMPEVVAFFTCLQELALNSPAHPEKLQARLYLIYHNLHETHAAYLEDAEFCRRVNAILTSGILLTPAILEGLAIERELEVNHTTANILQCLSEQDMPLISSNLQIIKALEQRKIKNELIAELAVVNAMKDRLAWKKWATAYCGAVLAAGGVIAFIAEEFVRHGSVEEFLLQPVVKVNGFDVPTYAFVVLAALLVFALIFFLTDRGAEKKFMAVLEQKQKDIAVAQEAAQEQQINEAYAPTEEDVLPGETQNAAGDVMATPVKTQPKSTPEYSSPLRATAASLPASPSSTAFNTPSTPARSALRTPASLWSSPGPSFYSPSPSSGFKTPQQPRTGAGRLMRQPAFPETPGSAMALSPPSAPGTPFTPAGMRAAQ